MTKPTKRGPGQPKKADRDKTKVIGVSMPPGLRVWLATVGDGSPSRGARLVLAKAMKKERGMIE